ncbi:MAG: HAMP domain-containing protein [Anaerolineae bacterium]|nr:HAMP domain-containing protein [Anaerolineae bacterium]
MYPIQFDTTPYTATGFSLMIVGIAAVGYMLHLQEKPRTTWLLIFGLISFSLSMLLMTLQSIVFYGNAFYPLVDAFSVISMAVMIEFIFQFPRNDRSLFSILTRGLAWIMGIVSLIFCFIYGYQILLAENFAFKIPDVFPLMNPLSFVLALSLSIYRTISLQKWRPRGMMGIFEVLIWPQNRPARLMRNFSLALSIGTIQGVASLVHFDLLPGVNNMVLINLSMLIMLVAVVYASFDITARQPSLVVRLVGLSLVTLLAVLSVADMYSTPIRKTLMQYQYSTIIDNTRRVLRSHRMEGLPPQVSYILSWSLNDQGYPHDSAKPILLRLPENRNAALLINPEMDSDVPAIWGYTSLFYLSQTANATGSSIRYHYGSHKPGSYFEYVGFVFDLDKTRYEVGFNLDELNGLNQDDQTIIFWAILLSALFILFFFSYSFRHNLTQPLNRLLAGIHQAEAGNLDIQVDVTHNDEIGFLAASFNKMAGSLKQELQARENAEAELRQLNLTLEERVSNRTRELEAMYELSAAGIRTATPDTLVPMLLEKTCNALRANHGFILLFNRYGERRDLFTAAVLNLPIEWRDPLSNLSGNEDWIVHVLNQNEPLLIADSLNDDLTPPFMHEPQANTLILTPLQSEGQTLGLMGVARPVNNKFNLDEITLAISITNQVGVVVYAEQMRQFVQQNKVLEERRRLAQNLHDSVTRSLFELVNLTDSGQELSDTQQINKSRLIFEKIGQSARQAIREMRLFIHQLRPPELEKEGLINALDLRLAAVEGRSDVKAQLCADEGIRLPYPIEAALFDICQEALNNALKHAHARNVLVNLHHFGGGILLEVTDDGRGFTPTEKNKPDSGLKRMSSRAAEIGAEIEVASAPGAGTRVTVKLKSYQGE